MCSEASWNLSLARSLYSDAERNLQSAQGKKLLAQVL